MSRIRPDFRIGWRAAEEVCSHIEQHGPKYGIRNEMALLGANAKCFYAWEKGITNPSASMLQRMHHNGYDIMYIITGKRSLP
jgi:hypothetical protein